MDNEYKQLAVVAIVFLGALLLIFNFLPNDFKKSPNNYVGVSSGKSPVNAKKIPDEVYENTTKDDGLYDIINSDKKVIYWAYANCPAGKALKNSVEAGLSANDLSLQFTHFPDLQSGGVMVFCKNKSTKCAQNYLYSHCSDSVCILNPMKQEILFVNGHDAAEVVQKAVDVKNW